MINSIEPVNLTLIGGLPASGKTTLARKIAHETDAVRLCPDDTMADLGLSLKDSEQRARVEKELIEKCGQLLDQKTSVVFELALWKSDERDFMRDFGRKHMAKVALYFLDVPVEELLSRLRYRNALDNPEIGCISESEIRQWSVMVEKPTAEEITQQG